MNHQSTEKLNELLERLKIESDIHRYYVMCGQVKGYIDALIIEKVITPDEGSRLHHLARIASDENKSFIQ